MDLVGPIMSRELLARRTQQRARGQAAGDRHYDRLQAEAEACRGECTAPGSNRGRMLLGDGTYSQGIVAVDEQADPLVDAPPPGAPFVLTRPCYDCNRERWEAWQDGQLTVKKSAKPENAEDRRRQEDGRRRKEQQSFD